MLEYWGGRPGALDNTKKRHGAYANSTDQTQAELDEDEIMSQRSLAAVAILAVATAGCATLTNDQYQLIHFVAPYCGKQKIKCTATNKRGAHDFRPPEKVRIQRSDDDLKVVCEVNGMDLEPQDKVISRMKGSIYELVLALDLGIVDAIKDRHREYPDPIVLTACFETRAD